MARNRPVRICRIKQIASRDPKFHHAEIFDGAGRSMNELLIIFISGWVFRMLVISVLIVELQRWLFMSLVMVRFHVGIMMTYIVFVLSIIFVISFVGFSSKPSPIYGGLVLIISGAVGCGIVLSFGGSFLGLMVFLIYLGGMLVVFGYTTAMATEQYPEVWVSNKAVLGAFVMGLLSELLLACYILKDDEVDVVFEFNGMGD